MTHRGRLEVAPYSRKWPRLFEAERALLATAFAPGEFRIEHIGSTAVPGLSAKPTVDVLIGAGTLSDIEARIPAMEALGYQYVREHEAVLPQRRFFAKPKIRPRQFHVHAVELGSPFWTEHLLFRDSLRANRDLAAEYGTLKIDLTARFGDDWEGYTDAKAPFIQAILRRAAA
jgi:GrpB-like predicted nucleotidyltransferase (UPF0157 family)